VPRFPIKEWAVIHNHCPNLASEIALCGRNVQLSENRDKKSENLFQIDRRCFLAREIIKSGIVNSADG
jgi:hypothetical protein